MSALRHLVILLAVLAATWLMPGRAEAHAGHGATAATSAAAARLTDPEAVVPAQAAHCAGTCCSDGSCASPSLAPEPAAALPTASSRAVRQPDRAAPSSRTVEARLRPPRSRIP